MTVQRGENTRDIAWCNGLGSTGTLAMALVYMMRGKAKLWTRYLVRMGFRRIRSVTQSIGKSKKYIMKAGVPEKRMWAKVR